MGELAGTVEVALVRTLADPGVIANQGPLNPTEGLLVEGEELTSNFARSFGETEKLFEILETWNDQLNKVEPKLETMEPLTSASSAASGVRS